METISNVVTAASRAVWGESKGEADKQPTEPVSGVTGAGKPTDPYDAGNAEAQEIENQTSREAATGGQSGSGNRSEDKPISQTAAADSGELGSGRAGDNSGALSQEDRHVYPSNIGQKTLQLQRDKLDEPAISPDDNPPQETSDSRITEGDRDSDRKTNVAGTASRTQDDQTERPLTTFGDDNSTKALGHSHVDNKPSGFDEDRGAPGYIAGTPVRISGGGPDDIATSRDINSGQHTLDNRAASDLAPGDEAGRGDKSYVAGTPFQTQLGHSDTSAASHDHSSGLPSSAPRDAGDLSQPQQPSGGLIPSGQDTTSDDRGSGPSDALAAALSHRTYNISSDQDNVSHDAGATATSTGGLASSAPRLVGQEDDKYGPSGGIAQGGQPQGINVAGPVRPEHQTDKTGVTGLHSNDPKFSVVEPSSSNERTPVPVGGFGAVEPSVGADPTSGQPHPAPLQQQQGAERPRDEPTAGDSLLAVRESKEADERAAEAGGSTQGYTGAGGSSGGGEAYRSTGFVAHGGNFDAAKAGAPEEADRIIQQQGGLPHYPERSSHSLTAHVSSHGSHHDSEHDKTGLGTKLKEKLHIGH